MKKDQFKAKPGKYNRSPGRPRIPPELKEFDKITHTHLIGYLTKFLSLTREELAREMSNPQLKMIEVIIGGIVAKAASGADHVRLDFLLNRLIGKVGEPPKEVNINVHELSKLPTQEVLKIANQAVAYLESAERGEQVDADYTEAE